MNRKISEIILTFKREKDLNKNVLNFFAPTLVKLNYISERINKKQVSFEATLTFEDIVYKDLPSLLENYTKLPIEIRSVDVIKIEKSKSGDVKKTALDILIESLSLIIAKTNTLWENVLEENKTDLLVSHRILNYNTDKKNGDLIASEFEKEELNYQLDMEKEIKKLLRDAEGSWQTGFHKVENLKVNNLNKLGKGEQPHKGLTPQTFIIIFIILLAVVGIIGSIY